MIDTTTTDAAIVTRVLAGDREAFAHLIDRYQKSVYGLAYYHLGRAEDAADAAQAAFVATFYRIAQLREPAKFAPWLRTLTVNACRLARRQPQFEEMSGDPAAEGDIASRVETRVIVAEVLRCLSPQTRLTLILFHVHGHSLAEIAAFLDVPVTTIKSRLRDARTRLRKEWRMMMEEPEPLPTNFTLRVMRTLNVAGAVYNLAFTPDGKHVAHQTFGYAEDRSMVGDLFVREVASGEVTASLPVGSLVVGPSWCRDGKTLAFSCYLSSGKMGSELRLWDVESNETRTLAHLPDIIVRCVAMSPVGDVLATGGSDEVRVWDLKTGAALWSAPHLPHILSIGFSPDGRLLATNGAMWDKDLNQMQAGDIRLWDAAAGVSLGSLDGPNSVSECSNMAFSPDARLLVTGYGNEGFVFDVQTRAVVRKLIGHEDIVSSVTFPPDGIIIVTGSHDKTVRLWRADTGEELRKLSGQSAPVYAVSFTPDGKTLASADVCGEIKIRRME